MISDIEEGVSFVEHALALRPDILEMFEDQAQLARFKEVLQRRTEQILARGEGIGLDVLIVTARRSGDRDPREEV